MNEGKIRVLFDLMSMLGTGVNAQKKRAVGGSSFQTHRGDQATRPRVMAGRQGGNS